MARSIIKLDNTMLEESRHWVNKNKGFKIADGVGYYPSPRLSSEIADCSMPMTFDHYSFCSLGCVYCVVEGTLIATPTGQIPIEKINVGDVILSFDVEENHVDKDTVVSTMTRTSAKVLEIVLEDGTKLKITDEHPVYVKGKGWTKAGDLEEGDDVIRFKRADASYRMWEKNPMKERDVAARQSATLKESFQSGRLDDFKAKLKSAGTKNLVAWNRSNESKASNSIRMKTNNPMHNRAVAKRVSKTKRKLFQSGRLIPPWLGKTKPDAVERMSGPTNPMKDSKKCAETLRKSARTWRKNGRVSEGELLVKKAIADLYESFMHQVVVEGPKRVYILDFLLPEKRICIEYDGHSGHYSKAGMTKDRERDLYILKNLGIKTVRINRDEAFIPFDSLKMLLAERITA